MKEDDKGMDELLELLKSHPELINGIVFNPESIKQLLKKKSARRLLNGVDVKTFLRYVSDDKHGGPIAVCSQKTKGLCKGKTKIEVLCYGGTRPK